METDVSMYHAVAIRTHKDQLILASDTRPYFRERAQMVAFDKVVTMFIMNCEDHLTNFTNGIVPRRCFPLPDGASVSLDRLMHRKPTPPLGILDLNERNITRPLT